MTTAMHEPTDSPEPTTITECRDKFERRLDAHPWLMVEADDQWEYVTHDGTTFRTLLAQEVPC